MCSQSQGAIIIRPRARMSTIGQTTNDTRITSRNMRHCNRSFGPGMFWLRIVQSLLGTETLEIFWREHNFLHPRRCHPPALRWSLGFHQDFASNSLEPLLGNVVVLGFPHIVVVGITRVYVARGNHFAKLLHDLRRQYLIRNFHIAVVDKWPLVTVPAPRRAAIFSASIGAYSFASHVSRYASVNYAVGVSMCVRYPSCCPLKTVFQCRDRKFWL